MTENIIQLNKYVVVFSDSYMAVKNNEIIWTTKDKANTYPSKYAAKKHMKLFGDIKYNAIIPLHQIPIRDIGAEAGMEPIKYGE